MSKQKEFQIVATNYMLRFFRQIDIFKVELGMSLKQMDQKAGNAPTIKVRDPFVKKYENINAGKFTHKYGSIGTIIFYEDISLPRYEFHIYKDDQIYEILATDDDIKKTANDYLTEILKMISGETPDQRTDKESGAIKNLVYTNMPKSMNPPDMKLPKDQYVDALIKRRKTAEAIRKQK